MSPTGLLIPTYQQMLRTLAGLLDKFRKQMSEAEAETVLAARLAPDMYPLSSQFRFAAFQAQEATFRLRGDALPAWLEEVAAEGRNAGEKPGSIAEAKARIDEAISFLTDLAPDALDADTERMITLELSNDLIFEMTREQYIRDWAVPQFYFHTVTAYAILRNHGLDIGKADYVPHMLSYARAGTDPRP